MKNIRLFLHLKFMVVLCATLAFGQSGGSITGTVKDGAGAAVPGATVMASNPANGVAQTASTNEAGNFVFPQLPPGVYAVKVEKSGFKAVEKTNVVLSIGDKLNAGDFTLEVGAVSETVQVTADAGQLLIKTESGERADLVSGQQLRSIGINGRNAIDLARLVPGVIAGGPASGSGTSTVTNITGQDAGNRLLGTYTAGNLAGLQPRLRVTGEAQSAPNQINLSAFSVPGINDKGPYSRLYLRNPGINNHDLSILKNFPVARDGKSYLQLRLEMFNFINHTQFSGVNRTTNLTNGAGQTGAAVFGNYTGLTITNNTRPAGSTAILGTFFGEYNAARDPRIIQVAAKFYF